MEQRYTDERAISLAGAGFGAAGVCLLEVLGLLASPNHEAVFHRAGSAQALFLPALLDLALLSGLAFGLLYAVRERLWLRRVAWSAMLGAMPWIGLKTGALLLGKVVPHWASLGCLVACAGLVAAGVFWLDAERFERARSCGHSALLVLAVPTALMTVQVLWCGFEARHLNEAAAMVGQRPIAPVNLTQGRRAGSGRVIWLVLDELAFRQAFESRSADLELPEFDRLKAEATLFTQVVPAAHFTEVAIPSLIAGREAGEMRPSADGMRLALREGHGPWWRFDERDTVFADAQQMGYRTAVVGWYEPYCRILPNVLATCYWTGPSNMSSLYPGESVVQNAVYPVKRMLRKVPNFLFPKPGVTTDEIAEGGRHVQDFVRLNEQSEAALGSDKYDFVYLHMPVPHPTGIYDRRRKQFAVDRSSYVDNLALADLYLGQLRKTLESRGEWDAATVVLMGDHSWRTKLLWKDNQPWSAEDQAASEGTDDRPAYAVKLPRQKQGTTIATKFEAVRTRALLDALLRGEIANPEELQGWVDGRKSPLEIATEAGHSMRR